MCGTGMMCILPFFEVFGNHAAGFFPALDSPAVFAESLPFLTPLIMDPQYFEAL